MSIGRLNFKKTGRRKSASNSQAIQTLGVIMGLFTACWLPFFVLAVVRSICGENCDIPVWVSSLLTWLGYINSCLNPIIYARFNREFRTPFREILCCRCHKINESIRHTEYLYRYGNWSAAATSIQRHEHDIIYRTRQMEACSVHFAPSTLTAPINNWITISYNYDLSTASKQWNPNCLLSYIYCRQ